MKLLLNLLSEKQVCGWGGWVLYLSAMLVGRSPIGRSSPPHSEAESTWKRRPTAQMSSGADHKTDATA